MTEARQFISETIQVFLEPAKRQTIPEWMATNFRFPSDTSEPGLYNVKRAPYQIDVLTAMSPQSPARQINLCFGAQMGKTICECGAMSYYADSYPRAQGFAFSNEGELKSFVKTKFDPIMRANPLIKAKFGQGARSTGDTVSEKLYPGGFLKFLAANTEASMRSYSVAVMTADEIDTYPANVGGNGDPITQLTKRTNTFADTRKLIFSSTPANEYSLILRLMEQSTYRKYYVPCPHCRQKFTFELEYEPAGAADLKLVVMASAPQSNGISRAYSKAAQIGEPLAAASEIYDLKTDYDAKNGAPTAAAPKVFMKYFFVNTKTGEKSGDMLAVVSLDED